MNAVKLAIVKWHAAELTQGFDAFHINGEEGQKIVDAAYADGRIDLEEVKAVAEFVGQVLADEKSDYNAIFPLVQFVNSYGLDESSYPSPS
jgi:hypothetical protein